MVTITGLDDFPSAVAALELADGRTALACVHLPTPGTSEIAIAKAYLVDSAGRATLVGASEPLGKDVACALTIVGTTLRLWVTEAAPGQGGATSRCDRYEWNVGVGAAGSVGSAADTKLRAALKAALTGM